MTEASNYRKIWEKANGEIPVDGNGRSFEIHHIDGNRNNNDISNLKCVSIEEHYQIHYNQGDYGACVAIVNRLMEDTDEKSKLISKLASKRNKELVSECLHPFQSKEWREKYHNARNKERVENKTHNFVTNNPTHKRVSRGTHNWQLAKNTVPCIDKQGNYLRVPKEVFHSQTGPKNEREFVHNTSTEGKKRISLFNK